MNDVRKEKKNELSTSMHVLIHSSAVECGWDVTSCLKILLYLLTCCDGWYPGTLSYNKIFLLEVAFARAFYHISRK